MRAAACVLGLLAGLLGPSCKSDGDGIPTCEEVGEHLSAICASTQFGEGVRSDCQAFGLDAGIRRCLMQATECSTDTLSIGCGLADIILTCTATTSCPAPLHCDQTLGECVECSSNTDCPAGRVCSGTVCVAGP